MTAATTKVALFGVALMILVTIPVNASNSTSPETGSESRDIYSMLDGSLKYVYVQVAFFLEEVVQQRYLTSMNEYVNEQEDIGQQFIENWEEWVVYGIGYVICAAIGIVVAIVMLVAGPIVCCCRCCGNCGAKKSDKKKKKKKSKKKKKHGNQAEEDADATKHKGPSRCCCIGSSVALVIVTAALLFGAIPLVMFDVEIAAQIDGDYLTSVDNGLVQLLGYTDGAVRELDTVCLGGYVETEAEVFGVLEAIPDDVLEVIDNETGVVTSVNQLESFTDSLPQLLDDLLTIDRLSGSLTVQSDDLAVQLDNVVGDINATLQASSCIGDCVDVVNLLSTVSVKADFSVVNVTDAILAVNASIEADLGGQVSNISDQIDSIPRQVNDTIAQPIDDAKTESETVKREMDDTFDDMNSSLSEPINKARNFTQTAKDEPVVHTIATAVFWTLMVLIVVLFFISAFNIVGILLGAVLPYNGLSDAKKTPCCTKSVGSGLLLTGSVLTFVAYWLMMLLVCVAFVVGGLAHTELCRHMTHVHQSQSSAVLDIFDRFIAENIEVDPNYELRPFQSYADCSLNQSLYTALNVSQNPDWDLSNIDTQPLEDAIENIRDTPIDLAEVDLYTDAIGQTLGLLDDVFSGTNFTAICLSVKDTIMTPDIDELVQQLRDLGDPALDDSISQLNNISRDLVTPMSHDQRQLVTSLESAEAVVGGISFAEIATTLNESEATINANGSRIASRYVNDTADAVNATLMDFLDEMVVAVEDDLARCAPLYDGVTVVVDATCVTGLYSINAFWYNLGWCLLFLIPSLALAMSLSSTLRDIRSQRRTSPTGQSEERDLDGIAMTVMPTNGAINSVNQDGRQPPKPMDDVIPGGDPTAQQWRQQPKAMPASWQQNKVYPVGDGDYITSGDSAAAGPSSSPPPPAYDGPKKPLPPIGTGNSDVISSSRPSTKPKPSERLPPPDYN